MTSNLRLLFVCALAALAILLSSCAAPYFERAAMEPGFAWGAGVGVGGGSFVDFRSDPDAPHFSTHVAPKVTAYCRYNFSQRFGLFTQLTTGNAFEFGHHGGFNSLSFPWGLMEMAELQLGTKFGLSATDALRVDIGTVGASYGIPVPVLFETVWLRDLNESWTTNLGLGTRGLVGGMGYHFPMGNWAAGHVSLTGAFTAWQDDHYTGNPPRYALRPRATGQLGLALEPRPRRTD